MPLLAMVGKRLRGEALAVMVAALTAINPLQIWYANEARMYTLAVLLVTAASYILWRAIAQAQAVSKLPTRTIVRHLLLYLLLAGLSFYTHYTAAILILGQGVFWLLILWRQGHKRLLLATAVLALTRCWAADPFHHSPLLQRL